MGYSAQLKIVGSTVTQHTKPLVEGLEAVVGAFVGFDRPLSRIYNSIVHTRDKAVHYVGRLASVNGHVGTPRGLNVTGPDTDHGKYNPPSASIMTSQLIYREADIILNRAGYGGKRLGNQILVGGRVLANVNPNEGILTTSDAAFHNAVSVAISSANDAGLNYRIKVELR